MANKNLKNKLASAQGKATKRTKYKDLQSRNDALQRAMRKALDAAENEPLPNNDDEDALFVGFVDSTTQEFTPSPPGTEMLGPLFLGGLKDDLMNQIVAKALNNDTMPAYQLTDLDAETFHQDSVVEPPWSFAVLKSLLVSDVVHASAVETKANDYAYSGWKLSRTRAVEMAIEDNQINEQVVIDAEDEVQRFLETCFDGLPVEDLMRDFAIEFEALGIAGFEVLRTNTGYIDGVKSIPFDSVRFLDAKGRKATGATYIQRRFNKKRYFVNWLDNVQYTDKTFDPLRATFDEFPETAQARRQFIRPAQNLTGATTGRSVTNFKDAANDLYVLARRPFTRSDMYGTPGGIQALGAMLAMRKIESYNLNFFDSKGVPQYAIILKNVRRGTVMQAGKSGTQHTKAGGMVELTRTVSDFFEKKLVSGDRGVLVMGVPPNAEIEFERLSSEKVEASFADYEDRMREAIRMAHRVPPHAMGIIESANLGGGRDTAQLRRYRDHIVSPGQRQLANVINTILRAGLLVPYFKFEFLPVDIEEEQELRDLALRSYKDGAITPNEVRKQLPFELAEIPPELGGDVLHIRTPSTVRINEDIADLETAVAFMFDRERAKQQRARGALLEAADLLGYDDEDTDENEQQRKAAGDVKQQKEKAGGNRLRDKLRRGNTDAA